MGIRRRPSDCTRTTRRKLRVKFRPGQPPPPTPRVTSVLYAACTIYNNNTYVHACTIYKLYYMQIDAIKDIAIIMEVWCVYGF